jgi:anti-anti-sigma factor
MASVDVMVPGQAGPAVVRMAGEFDLANADDLRVKLQELDRGRAVVLDLAETSFIDSSILAVFAELVRRGIPLTVENARPIVAKVLVVSGIGTLVA